MSIEPIPNICLVAWADSSNDADEESLVPELDFTHDIGTLFLPQGATEAYRKALYGEFTESVDELSAALLSAEMNLPPPRIEPPIILTVAPPLLIVRDDIVGVFEELFSDCVHSIDWSIEHGALQHEYKLFSMQVWVDAVRENWTSACPMWAAKSYQDGKTLVHPLFDMPGVPDSPLFGVRDYGGPFIHVNAWNALIDSAHDGWEYLNPWRLLRYSAV